MSWFRDSSTWVGRLLAVTLLIAAAVASFQAVGANADDESAGMAAIEPEAPSGGVEMSELKGLRTRFSRTFEAADGSRSTRIWQTPVNYVDGAEDGLMRVIDPTLKVTADGSLTTQATGYDLVLPEDLSAPVEVSKGRNGVAFSLDGAEGSPAFDESEAIYEDVLPAVDAKYTAGESFLKEELILASPAAQRRFTFRLDASEGLTPRLNDAGGIRFDRADGASSVSIAPPVMVDAAGNASTALEYALHRDGDDWRLVLDAGGTWLEDPARAWPVAVDPTVYFGADISVTIASNTPNTQTGQSWIHAGRRNGGLSRALLRMNLSGIPASAQVLSATLNIHESSDSPGTGVGVTGVRLFEAGSSWTSGATWNTRDGSTPWYSGPGGDHAGVVINAQTINASCNCWYQFDVRSVVSTWVKGPGGGGSPNYGLIMKTADENAAVSAGFDGLWASLNPWMEVNWATAPTIAFSGPIWTSRSNIESLPKNLDVTAAVASGKSIREMRFYVDENYIKTVPAGCSLGASCNLSHSLSITPEILGYDSGGYHTVRVETVDDQGLSTMRSMSFYWDEQERTGNASAPDAPDVPYDPAGDVCTADPTAYCGADDAQNAAMSADDAEPPLIGDGSGGSARGVISDNWGIADEHGPMFGFPAQQALGLRLYRKITPWNVATQSRASSYAAAATDPANNDEMGRPVRDRAFVQWNDWYSRLPENASAIVSFTRADHRSYDLMYGSKTTILGNRGQPKSISAYVSAFETFRRRYPRIRRFTPWNEPNAGYYAARPVEAGRLYQALYKSCKDPLLPKGVAAAAPDCHVIAGDFTDFSVLFRNYIKNYKKGARIRELDEQGKITWAMHIYNAQYQAVDAQGNPVGSRDRSRLNTFLANTRGRIWVTESGAFSYRCPRDEGGGCLTNNPTSENDRKRPTTDENGPRRYAAMDLNYLINNILTEPRFKRFYYYQWADHNELDQPAYDSPKVDPWGTGLMRETIDGDPLDQRAAPATKLYCVYKNRRDQQARSQCIG